MVLKASPSPPTGNIMEKLVRSGLLLVKPVTLKKIIVPPRFLIKQNALPNRYIMIIAQAIIEDKNSDDTHHRIIAA